MSIHPNNVFVAKKLELLADMYEQKGQIHRARAFSNATEAVINLGEKDIAQSYKVRKIPGIGESSQAEIAEILQKGTSNRIEYLLEEMNRNGESPRINILHVLTNIMCLDMSDAVRLIIYHNITTLTTLRKLVTDKVIEHPTIVKNMYRVDNYFNFKLGEYISYIY